MPTTKAEPKTPSKSSSSKSTPKSGGIPKWMIVVIIAVVVLYALFYIGGMIVGNMVKAKMGITGMKMDNDGKSFAIQGKNGAMMQVGENVQLPAGFPKDMPIYPGAKLQSAIDTKEGYSITYIVENVTAEQMQAWYKSELAKSGWTNEMDKMGGGFFPVKKAPYAGVIAVVAEKGVGHVTINVGTEKQ